MSTKRLSKVVATEAMAKPDANTINSEVYKLFQRGDLFLGLNRTYTPDKDGDRVLPPESKKVQMTVKGQMERVNAALTKLLNVSATRDWGNCVAKADLKVGDVTIVKGAPAPYLLFLDKVLKDLKDIVEKMPTLASTEDWEKDPNDNLWKSKSSVTIRTEKTPEVLVKAPATDKHQADTEVFYKDIPVGKWTNVQLSGGISPAAKETMLKRITQLQEANREAREEANTTMIEEVEVADNILDFIFKDML
jgi:hypothetical protein